MYTVYKHTTPSGKAYIGATGQNPKHRWDNGKGYRHNRRFCDAIQKYGWGNIEHEVISTGLGKEQAYAMEAELIAKYDTTNPAKGYNISIGGEYGGLGRSHSNEARRKMSEAKKGTNHPNYGKHLSAETRRKISEAHKGTHHSAESRRKISEAVEGHTVSSETRRKISKALRGAKNPNFGKHHSAETRRKMSEAKCKKVVCVETGEVYRSLYEASKAAGVSLNAISNALRGESKTSGGYHWTYAK